MQDLLFNPFRPAHGHVVGRDAELRRLNEWLALPAGDAGAALIIGPAAIGKTTLLRRFVATARERMPAALIRARREESEAQRVEEALATLRLEGSRTDVLVAVDEADNADLAVLFDHLRQRLPGARLIGAVRDSASVSLPSAAVTLRLSLGPLSVESATALLRLGLPDVAPAKLAGLARTAGGLPFFLQLIGSRIAAGESVEAAVDALGEQRYEFALAHPDSQGDADAVDIRISAVSDALIRRLAAQPDLLHELHPRRFEELMAELYAREGFEVELTPETNDGGVDLYLIRHEVHGPVLTVVDCKRYAPSRPVRIELVRQMLGVIETTKASAGVVVTTSRFTRGAQALQAEYPFRLGLQDYFGIESMLRRAGNWRHRR